MASKLMFVNRGVMMKSLVPPNGIVAEVGVQHGTFAAEILKVCNPRMLYLIDIWKHQEGNYTVDPANVNDATHEERYQEVVKKFNGKDQVHIIREMSVMASEAFDDNYFNGVYIDANHMEEGIRADIEAWWPKVKPGGVLAGHDYYINDWVKVQPVVDEFVKNNKLKLITTTEKWQSWAVIKPAIVRIMV